MVIAEDIVKISFSPLIEELKIKSVSRIFDEH